jgi:crossover junction endodeoxyribonuclease RuvC
MIRILGIDPGSVRTGFGVIEVDGTRVRHVGSGCIRTQGAAFPPRLRQIYSGLAEAVAEFAPHEIAVESAFVHKNAASALKLGQARAAALCGTMIHNLAVYEYAPREVKLAVVGSGGADKTQVQHMVKLLLRLQGELQADIADALGVALCHAHGRSARRHLECASQAAKAPLGPRPPGAERSLPPRNRGVRR